MSVRSTTTIITTIAAAAIALAGCGDKKTAGENTAAAASEGTLSRVSAESRGESREEDSSAANEVSNAPEPKPRDAADDPAPARSPAKSKPKRHDSKSIAASSGSLAAPGRGGAPATSSRYLGKGSGAVAANRSRRINRRHKRIRRPVPKPRPQPDTSTGNTEAYKDYGKNPFVDTSKDNLSTFAVDVDTASYAISRRKIVGGTVPPKSAVRVEEFVNYFKYDYDGPTGRAPFAVHMDAAPSPFSKGKHILRVGVQAKKLSIMERKKANLVFLVDVSGSMRSPDKLPLAKRALRLLISNLKDGDTVSLVTYAGSTKVVLPPTGVENRAEIVSAIEDLRSGGGTGMASGMDLAYEQAAQNLASKTISRVIVMSDGDANIGRISAKDMLATIKGKVKEGVTMSSIGFGMGNYKDTMMEQLANKGNGNYYYIDTFSQAKRVFQEQLGGTLEVVAKDVKIQVDFDKKAVKRYRLVGYENRDIADNDFRNDKVDAGEIGAGHTVTAIYEVELADTERPLATVRVRNKKPRGTKAKERAYDFDREKLYKSFDSAPSDFRFAAAVMATAEILRRSEHAGGWSIDRIIKIAKSSSKADDSERQEFISLVEKIKPLRKRLASR